MLKSLIQKFKLAIGIYDHPPGSIYGLLAEFPDPGALYEAAKEVRSAGYRHFDVHSPFPIHGMDRAMGLGNSKVGYVALGGGITGALLGLWLQWWMNAIDYPIIVSGKPFFAVEPSVPVIFELTILFSAFGAVAGMLALNGLPRPYNPLFYSRRFLRVTDDGFFLHIAASDEQFDQEETASFLRRIGATGVEVIADEELAETE
jgi:hypothetical protein